MILLLVACAVLYFFLGDAVEGLLLLVSVFLILGIHFVQEKKTQRTLESLRQLSSPRALVIRDGRQIRIAGRDVVPGDLVIVKEGDRVACDGVVLWSINLMTDESMLTGESVSVSKRPVSEQESDMQRPGGDRTPYVYSGTLVVRGQGVIRSAATGVRTEMGRIGKTLSAITSDKTRLQTEIGRMVKIFAAAGGFICLLIVAGFGWFYGDWMKGVLSGLTTAMSLLPEEFPVVLTIFLAMGAWRISQKKVLTRHIPALENLGSANVLCVDKTGTLTLNQMSVARLWLGGGKEEKFHVLQNVSPSSLPEEAHELVEYAVLASHKDPFDPMEIALYRLGRELPDWARHHHEDWRFVQEYPLSPKLLAMSCVWKTEKEASFHIAAKGAPEDILDLCHCDAKATESVLQKVQALASDGLRVLGVAKARFAAGALPSDQHEFDFEFIGLVALEDPVRPGVKAAIEECGRAGLRVIMMTGDYPATAQNIARQIGLSHPEQVVTGEELSHMNDESLRKIILTTNIFARVMPEQKLRIVEALQAEGVVVAMTGDGVNDAPSLKAADIGIAMGERGTDVAREAADLVLLDDSFPSLVTSVRMGRRIFDNIQKAISYLVAVHVPIAGLALLPILLKLPMVFSPIHIVFLELIIDPACSMAFEAEPEEADIMNRPPRDLKKPFFDKRRLAFSGFQGAAVLVCILLLYSFLIRMNVETTARASAFTALVVANLGLIFTNRSRRRILFHRAKRSANRIVRIVACGALAVLAFALYVPPAQRIFGFESLNASALLISVAVGLAGVFGVEVFKPREKNSP